MSNQWYDIEGIQWTDNPHYEWGTIELNHLYVSGIVIYAATTAGVYISDVYSPNVSQGFIPISSGSTSVWCDADSIFIGTYDGIYKANKQSQYTASSYVRAPFINSNTINHVHGNDSVIMSCTNIGVNITRKFTEYTTKCQIQNSTKCFVTVGGQYYYNSSTGDEYSVNKLYSNNSDWSLADVVYTTGSGFLHSGITINDIFVTENTSVNHGSNTLFIATSSGVYIYDEGSSDYYIFNSDLPNNNYLTVTADIDANINSNNMYISTGHPNASFIVVDLSMKTITDEYTTTTHGRDGDALLQEDVISTGLSI